MTEGNGTAGPVRDFPCCDRGEHDDDRLLAEADALVRSWDQQGSWSGDSPVGMVMRLAAALRRQVPSPTPTPDRQALAARLVAIVETALSDMRCAASEYCISAEGRAQAGADQEELESVRDAVLALLNLEESR